MCDFVCVYVLRLVVSSSFIAHSTSPHEPFCFSSKAFLSETAITAKEHIKHLLVLCLFTFWSSICCCIFQSSVFYNPHLACVSYFLHLVVVIDIFFSTLPFFRMLYNTKSRWAKIKQNRIANSVISYSKRSTVDVHRNHFFLLPIVKKDTFLLRHRLIRIAAAEKDKFRRQRNPAYHI